ncbi:MAG: pyridoxal-phosphate dependent enzyme [Chloroflexi bacterium]|nr:pyridoxal-phosphate dependent enzyme [Chloroflexota bacterium]
MERATRPIDILDIREAARLHGILNRTPLLHSGYFSRLTGGDVWLKAECLQRTGSFKLRGAANMVLTLSDAERARGVIAASAGNHAQGVAVAARESGVHATVVMPRTASLAKVAAAALLAGAVSAHGQQTVVLLSGGNIDMNLLGRIVEHGLAHSGRYLVLRVEIDDRPGQLASVLDILAGAGANVLDVEHRRTGSQLTLGRVQVEFLLETRNADHAHAVLTALDTAGYHEDTGLERRDGTPVLVAKRTAPRP